MGKKSLAGIVLSSLAIGTLFSSCETTPTPVYRHHSPRTVVVPAPVYHPPRQNPTIIVVPPRSPPPRYIPPRSHSPTFHHSPHYIPRHSPGFYHAPRVPQYCPPPRYIAPRQNTPSRSPSSSSSGSQRFRLRNMR